MHNHRWEDRLADATAPACSGLLAGSLAHGNSPPMVTRIDRSQLTGRPGACSSGSSGAGQLRVVSGGGLRTSHLHRVRSDPDGRLGPRLLSSTSMSLVFDLAE